MIIKNNYFVYHKLIYIYIYIRGLKNEDISYFIKKVIFTLHPSFPNSKRSIYVNIYLLIFIKKCSY